MEAGMSQMARPVPVAITASRKIDHTRVSSLAATGAEILARDRIFWVTPSDLTDDAG
jgi:hypothetical protein